MVPSRWQLALVVALALGAAVALIPLTRNPFIELVGETMFVGVVLLFAFTLAGASRQTLLPRWVAQVLAVTLGRCCRRSWFSCTPSAVTFPASSDRPRTCAAMCS
jgi:hypothetical protein